MARKELTEARADEQKAAEWARQAKAAGGKGAEAAPPVNPLHSKTVHLPMPSTKEMTEAQRQADEEEKRAREAAKEADVHLKRAEHAAAVANKADGPVREKAQREAQREAGLATEAEHNATVKKLEAKIAHDKVRFMEMQSLRGPFQTPTSPWVEYAAIAAGLCSLALCAFLVPGKSKKVQEPLKDRREWEPETEDEVTLLHARKAPGIPDLEGHEGQNLTLLSMDSSHKAEDHKDSESPSRHRDEGETAKTDPAASKTERTGVSFASSVRTPKKAPGDSGPPGSQVTPPRPTHSSPNGLRSPWRRVVVEQPLEGDRLGDTLVIIDFTDPRAEALGFQVGERIVHINGVPVFQQQDFQQVLSGAFREHHQTGRPIVLSTVEPASSYPNHLSLTADMEDICGRWQLSNGESFVIRDLAKSMKLEGQQVLVEQLLPQANNEGAEWGLQLQELRCQLLRVDGSACGDVRLSYGANRSLEVRFPGGASSGQPLSAWRQGDATPQPTAAALRGPPLASSPDSSQHAEEVAALEAKLKAEAEAKESQHSEQVNALESKVAESQEALNAKSEEASKAKTDLETFKAQMAQADSQSSGMVEALRQREDKLAAADAELASLRERSERPAVLKFPYVRKDRVRRSGHACLQLAQESLNRTKQESHSAQAAAEEAETRYQKALSKVDLNAEARKARADSKEEILSNAQKDQCGGAGVARRRPGSVMFEAMRELEEVKKEVAELKNEIQGEQQKNSGLSEELQVTKTKTEDLEKDRVSSTFLTHPSFF
eukprot:g11180.t1